MNTPRPWGCPKCHSTLSRVVNTAHDEEHYVIRDRRCSKCGNHWATEERPLHPSVGFWTRAYSRWRKYRSARRLRSADEATRAAERERIRQREYKRRRYHSDPAFRSTVLARVKDYRSRVRLSRAADSSTPSGADDHAPDQAA